mmetsp:Transcript_48181/g.52120  ORF Transcript_48181/g.52120 Transcript_48181/m.52120 type:complete len:89 (-) Transcript_48181:757-1023(-)
MPSDCVDIPRFCVSPCTLEEATHIIELNRNYRSLIDVHEMSLNQSLSKEPSWLPRHRLDTSTKVCMLRSNGMVHVVAVKCEGPTYDQR